MLRERDSNPWYPLEYTWFPIMLLKPLGHLSKFAPYSPTLLFRSRPALLKRVFQGYRPFCSQDRIWTCIIGYYFIHQSSLSRTVYHSDTRLFCDPDRIRTCDLLLRRQLLYPAELRDHMEPPDGLEPPTIWLQIRSSTNWAKGANLADFTTESCLSICRALEASSRMFRNLFLDYLIVAVVSTVLVESPVRQVLSAQMLSHAVESAHLVSVLLLLQAAKDKVATAIKEKINFFIRLLLTIFFK